MNVEVTQLPQSRVTLAVELSAQEVDQALDRTYKNLVHRVSIPGFRKGKAPRPVVERMVGHELFLHEATDEAVRWGYRKAVDESDLTPIDEAEIDTGDSHEHVESGQPFRFQATVTVKPTVQLPDLHSIHIERTTVEVTDQDVDEVLETIRERNATLEPTVRAAEIGDVVTINVTGKVDGEEAVNRENYDFELIQETEEQVHPVFPGLSEQLVGVNRGDIKDIPLPLPELYPEAELAGKTMFLRILVKEIKRKVLPDLDDDLAQSVSETQTLDALKDLLRQNIEVERRMEAEQTLVNEAIEGVVSRSFVEIPVILIDDELDRMMRDMERFFETQHLSFEHYLETAGRQAEEIRAEMTEEATQNVKTSLVLGAVADTENIEVSGREIDASLEELLRTARSTEAERRRLRTSSSARANVRTRIRRQRAVARLVEIVTGGEEVSEEATAAAADQTAAIAEDTEETVAVEVGG